MVTRETVRSWEGMSNGDEKSDGNGADVVKLKHIHVHDMGLVRLEEVRRREKQEHGGL